MSSGKYVIWSTHDQAWLKFGGGFTLSLADAAQYDGPTTRELLTRTLPPVGHTVAIPVAALRDAPPKR